MPRSTLVMTVLMLAYPVSARANTFYWRGEIISVEAGAKNEPGLKVRALFSSAPAHASIPEETPAWVPFSRFTGKVLHNGKGVDIQEAAKVGRHISWGHRIPITEIHDAPPADTDEIASAHAAWHLLLERYFYSQDLPLHVAVRDGKVVRAAAFQNGQQDVLWLETDAGGLTLEGNRLHGTVKVRFRADDAAAPTNASPAVHSVSVDCRMAKGQVTGTYSTDPKGKPPRISGYVEALRPAGALRLRCVSSETMSPALKKGIVWLEFPLVEPREDEKAPFGHTLYSKGLPNGTVRSAAMEWKDDRLTGAVEFSIKTYGEPFVAKARYELEAIGSFVFGRLSAEAPDGKPAWSVKTRGRLESLSLPRIGCDDFKPKELRLNAVP